MKGREYTCYAHGTGCGTFNKWKDNPEVLKTIQIVVWNRDDNYNRRSYPIGVWRVRELKIKTLS
jgi:hypothetical protein